MRNILAICVIVALTASGASGIDFWLSPAGIGGGASQGAPDILRLGGAGSVNVWVTPDTDKAVRNLSLNIHSTNDAVLDFTGVTVFTDVGEAFGLPIRRFEFVKDSNSAETSSVTVDPDAINDFQGFSVTGAGMIIANLGVASAVQFGDPNYDAANGSFLLAQVDYNVVGPMDSSTELFLQIGGNGINNENESSSDASIVFGLASDPGLNGDSDRGVDSATADATITVGVPEPSTVLLALIGLVGLGFTVRRK